MLLQNLGSISDPDHRQVEKVFRSDSARKDSANPGGGRTLGGGDLKLWVCVCVRWGRGDVGGEGGVCGGGSCRL